MTATQSAPYSLPPYIWAALRRAGTLMMNASLAIAIIFAAGVIAVATAAAGLALAGVALTLRLFSGGRATTAAKRTNGQVGMTLEARKTSHGWTVE